MAKKGKKPAVDNFTIGLMAALDLTDSYVYTKDANGLYLYVNQAVSNLFGLPAEEMVGKDDSSFFDIDLADDLRRNDRIVMEQGRTIEREERNVIKSTGETRYYWTIKKPVRNGAGEIIGLCGISTDITDRKLDRLSLADRESKLEAIIGNSPSALSMKTPDGRYALANPNLQRIHRLSEAQIVGKTDFDLYPEGIAEAFMENDRLVLETGERRSVEEVFPVDGKSCHYMSHIFPVFSDSGEIAYICRISLDITESRLAAIALKESEERVRMFIEHAPAALAMFDLEMRYLAVSRRWISDYGLEGREVIGASHYDIFPEIPKHWKSAHRRGMKGEVVAAREDRFEMEDGSARWLNWEVRPWYMATGEIGGIAIFTEDVTERKEIEIRLEQGEALYRSLFENMMNGFAYCRMLFEDGQPVDFIYLNVNKAFESQTGLHDVVGKRVSEVIPGIREQTPELFDIYGRVAKGSAPEHFEAYVEPLGDWFSISVYSPGQDHFVAVFDVITRKKQAENALLASEERLRTIMEHAPIGMGITSIDGRIRMVNQAFCDMLGYSSEELENKTFMDITHPEDRDVTRPGRDHLLAGRTDTYRVEKRYLRKDGSAIWVHLTSSLVRGASGSPPYFIGQVEDITERKRAEAELQIAATTFESQNGVMITDADLNILRVNTAFTEITGYAADEIVGRHPRMLQSGRHDDLFYKEMWASIKGTGKWIGEIWNRRKDGAIYPETLSISAVRNADGSVRTYVGTFIDITKRKEAEARVEHLAFYDQLTDLPNRRLIIDRLHTRYQPACAAGRSAPCC